MKKARMGFGEIGIPSYREKKPRSVQAGFVIHYLIIRLLSLTESCCECIIAFLAYIETPALTERFYLL